MVKLILAQVKQYKKSLPADASVYGGGSGDGGADTVYLGTGH